MKFLVAFGIALIFAGCQTYAPPPAVIKGPFVNVDDFGAKPDERELSDCAMVAGLPSLICPADSPVFENDRDKLVCVEGASKKMDPLNPKLHIYLPKCGKVLESSAFQPRWLRLNFTAERTTYPARVDIGTDNTNAITNAIDTIEKRGGGTVIFQGNKVYGLGSALNASKLKSPLTIDGDGATLYLLYEWETTPIAAFRSLIGCGREFSPQENVALIPTDQRGR